MWTAFHLLHPVENLPNKADNLQILRSFADFEALASNTGLDLSLFRDTQALP